MHRYTILLVVVTLCVLTDAKRSQGNIIGKQGEDWIFVDSFCFDNKGPGNLTWSGNSTNPIGDRLLFYNDDNWKEVWKNRNKLSCYDKIKMSHGNRTIIPGQVRTQPFHDDVRPYYWYFVIANCDGGQINFQYQFNFSNAGGSWDTQFSSDEQGLPFAYLAYWLIFTALLAVHLYGAWGLYRNEAYHPVVRLFTLCLALESVHCLFYFIHYAVYKNNGSGVPGLKGVAEILDIAFQLSFMFLLILFAKGYAISKQQLTERLILAIIFCILLVLYVSMFIWDFVGRNPAVTQYVYQSVPGILILLLRMLFLAWFVLQLIRTYREERNQTKTAFYVQFGAFYGVWFLLLPLIVIIASALTAWIKMKIVFPMYLTMNFLAMVWLVWLLWPSRAAEYFTSIGKKDLLLSGRSSSPYETL